MSRVISLEGVGKQYRLGEVGTGTLARDLERWWARSRGMEDPHAKIGESIDRQILWALKDVSLEVREGEVLGIIGANGAGKSTLLKLLARVTVPTTGFMRTRGRVASLLEVGTGFHPELTGRENIYLNGAILGMSRSEIKSQFDGIVDFSGCERFIDTPVKRYSSGMIVRLGFAVAAHLRCEIMIIDEVLAVGDAKFQKQCLGKIREVSSERGRTVLFVSHNLGVLASLCTRGVVIANGQLTFDGEVSDAVQCYLSERKNEAPRLRSDRQPTPGQEILLTGAWLESSEEEATNVVCNSDPLQVVVEFEVLVPGSSYSLSCEVSNLVNGPLFSSSTLDERSTVDLGHFPEPGRYRARCELPLSMMREGNYSVSFASAIPSVKVLDRLPGTINFEVVDSASPIATLGEWRPGVLVPRLPWKIESIASAEDESG